MNDTSMITKNGACIDLIERLKASPFYQACQNAFRDGTDLPLIVQPVHDPNFNPCRASTNKNPFCQLLNSSHGTCEQCMKEQQKLLSHSMEKAFSLTCFAGLEETAVPIRLGNSTIGFLKTGQIFTKKPTPEQFAAVTHALDAAKYSAAEKKKVLEQYKLTPVFKLSKYKGMITLLSIISLQLSDFLNRLLLESKNDEPAIVRKAKAYIDERITNNIDKKITLGEISNEVHVSVFYFCKAFKQATGMTFTEYVNRKRIELAKGELKNTEKQITEIAYAVGFQSLSQFNRCFLKFVGESPRQYRLSARKVPADLLIFS